MRKGQRCTRERAPRGFALAAVELHQSSGEGAGAPGKAQREWRLFLIHVHIYRRGHCRACGPFGHATVYSIAAAVPFGDTAAHAPEEVPIPRFLDAGPAGRNVALRRTIYSTRAAACSMQSDAADCTQNV
jgi:hypothetical protein